jgi:ankyrin repeat protein
MAGMQAALELMLDRLSQETMGPALNAADARGRSCLHYAMYRAREEIVQVLFRADVDLDPRDEDVRIPLPLFLAREKGEEPAWFEPTPVNGRGAAGQGRTPLDAGCASGAAGCVHTLVDRGANVNTADKVAAPQRQRSCARH